MVSQALSDKRRRIRVLDAARLAGKRKEVQSRLLALEQLLEVKQRQSGGERLHALGASAQAAACAELPLAQRRTEHAASEVRRLALRAEQCASAKKTAERTQREAARRSFSLDGVLEQSRRETDQLAGGLNLSAVRNFLGAYPEQELEEEFAAGSRRLEQTGVEYQSCEAYLLQQIQKGNLTVEACEGILGACPAAVYGILLSEKEKTALDQSPRPEWLPNLTPVFTWAEFESVMRRAETRPGALACYSVQAFRDHVHFVERLEAECERRSEAIYFDAELRSTGCEEAEYASVAYNEAERESCRRDEVKLAAEQEEAGETLLERSAEKAKAEALFDAARNALSEFGGEALAPERIAGAYPERKRKLNLQKKEKQEEAGQNEKTLRETQTMVLLTERLLPAGQKPDAPEQMELERDLGAQWRELEKEYQKQAKALKDGHTNLVRALTGLTAAYQNSAEQNAVQSMLELLSHPELSGDLYFTLDERIDQARHVTELLIGKLQSDLDDFDHARTDLIRQCVLPGQRMYQGLRELEKNARVRLYADRGRTEMLRFDLPREPDEEAASAVIAAELDTGTRELLERMADPNQTENKVREYAEPRRGSTN